MTAPTLPEFILARVAEDEVRATMREWHESGCDWFPDPQGYTYPCDCGVPERLRAQCAAYRRIVGQADEATSLDIQVDHEFRVGRRDMAEEPYVGDLILRALASIWADHADYRDEWRP